MSGISCSWASLTTGIWLLAERSPAVWFVSLGLGLGAVTLVYVRGLVAAEVVRQQAAMEAEQQQTGRPEKR